MSKKEIRKMVLKGLLEELDNFVDDVSDELVKLEEIHELHKAVPCPDESHEIEQGMFCTHCSSPAGGHHTICKECQLRHPCDTSRILGFEVYPDDEDD